MKVATTYFFMFLFCIGHSYCQSSYNISLLHGLSNSTVISICKDELGFMWFGTRYGLNKFDGNVVKTFLNEPNNVNSLSCNDYIFSIINDGRGGIWAGTKNGLNHYLVKTDNFQRYIHDSSETSLSDNLVNCIVLDHLKNIWVGTANGLNILKDKSHHFKRFLTSRAVENSLQNQVITLFEDKLGNIWAGTKAGIYRLWLKNGDWNQEYYSNSKGIEEGTIKSITQDLSGTVWIGTEQGNIYSYNRQRNRFIYFKLQHHFQNSIKDNIRKIFLDKKGWLWIATIKGLEIYDIKKGLVRLDWVSEQLKSESIKDIYQDDQGNIWVGTMYKGVYVINPEALTFDSYHNKNNDFNSLSGEVISALLTTKDGIWVGTEGNGLNLLNSKTGKVRRINNTNTSASVENSEDFVKALMEDKNGDIWIGTYLSGIKRYNPTSKSFINYQKENNSNTSLSSNYVSALLLDKQNVIWAGTENGINRYDPQKDEFYTINPQKEFGGKLLSPNITCLYEDTRERLWIGTPEGLHVYDKKNRQFVRFYKKTTSTSLYINCVKEDGSGNIWIGTYGDGVFLLTAGSSHFQRFNTHNGLPSNNIRAIEIDQAQTLWISTDHGLSNFNPSEKIFYNYGIKDGLPIEEFSTRSATLANGNILYFGSYNGLISFKNHHFINKNAPKIVFTDLKVFNKSVHFNKNDGIVKENIVLSPKVTLQYDQNVFSLSFAALNYIQPERNRYAYKLKGFDKQWVYTRGHTATYMNLPYGNYILLIKGSNNDGIWGKTTRIEISILPPWWRTWWSYCVYTLLIGAFAFYVFWSFKNRVKLKNDIYLKNWKNLQTQKQYDAKLDFFTHISHEIRTPLTLITAPLDKILEEVKGNRSAESQMQFVKKNADRLLQLVNELLDFRKLDSGAQHLHLQTIDFGIFCEEICEAFQPLAVLKNIKLQFENLAQHSLSANFDPNQMEKIISNLLSNAQKFTPSGGHIGIKLNEDDSRKLIFHIWDTGIGVEDVSKEHLFEEFYQGKNHIDNRKGWGIGLSMTRQLIELHGGTIWLEPSPKTVDALAVTCFSFSLPLSEVPALKTYAPIFKEKNMPLELMQFVDDEPQKASSSKHNFTIMVVEDNAEMRHFIQQSLSSEYDIITASDGDQAEQLLLEHIPDLVISDIAMPGKNGLQLCISIKEDIRTCHIPVILITARSAIENQIEGLSIGANAYITKPFSIKVLELTVRNTLAHILSVQQQYFRNLDFKPDVSSWTFEEEDRPKDISPLDFEFLAQLRQIVIEEMENPAFNVTNLVRKMGMSRTVIFKKVKALTDMNIQEFSKSVRLNAAALMLKKQQSNFSVSEISYKTGFSDPKYFSREFKKQFGMTPSEYNKSVHSL